MTTVGLRELRQDASDLVRRVEQGEEIGITVAGRLTARLVAVGPSPWRRWDEIASIFSGVTDHLWTHDRDLIDHGLENPWETARAGDS